MRVSDKTACTIGLIAHVDAGKTTLSEQMLFASGAIRRQGRVDHKDTTLDLHPIEKMRGITVYSDQAEFLWEGRRFILIDTPGHEDFIAETERVLPVLDTAVVLLDGTSQLKASTVSILRLLRDYGVPVIFFINKCDSSLYQPDLLVGQLQKYSDLPLLRLKDGKPDPEELALLDDEFCQKYLNGEANAEDTTVTLIKCIGSMTAYPVLEGSALTGNGVQQLLHLMAQSVFFRSSAAFSTDGIIYKVRRDANGEKICFMRLFQGCLNVRDALSVGETTEKINQIRIYKGASYETKEQAEAGDAFGVTGLFSAIIGDRIMDKTIIREHVESQKKPVMAVRVLPPKNCSIQVLLEKLRIMEEEDPLLHVQWDGFHQSVTLEVMGSLQIEILKSVLAERFGLDAEFMQPLVLYRETISKPVMGCGHYEPLRHYAEVHLLMEPGIRGSGITFSSQCHVDDLPLSYQSQIKNQVFSRQHLGVLTGSPLTDVKITLLSGKYHLKHTEGGDFRQAVYRAIRQGLMKTESLLLEPFYRFTIFAPAQISGKIMNDISSMGGRCELPLQSGNETQIDGRAPVKVLMGYTQELRAFTHGKGSILLESDGYDVCMGSEQVISEMAYQPEEDPEHSPNSVFCSHGAGYMVSWKNADSAMHLPVEIVD